MSLINIEELRLKKQGVGESPKPKTKPPRHKPGEKFLKGPIPLKWLTLASKLKGKVLNVSIAIWHMVGLTKSNRVKLTNKLLKSLNVDRHAKRRSLKELELAGLIYVERNENKNPIITILEPP